MNHLSHFAKSLLVIACLVLFMCTGEASAQTDLFFGDGSAGNVGISEFTRLTSDMYYRNLTIYAGHTLDTGGFRVFVSGQLTLESGARLSRDGNDGTFSCPGAALSPGTLGGSGAGGLGPNPGANAENSLGGSGGGGVGGFANLPAESSGGSGVFRSAFQALSGRSLDGALINGGGGGSGCSPNSGLGGSGGGVVVVAAATVVVSGFATISANGGNGDWGCGGGGGVVVVISTKAQPAGLQLQASGGVAPTPEMTGKKGLTDWLSSATQPDPPPATPTIAPREQQTLCNGGITLTSSSTSGNQWYLDRNAIAGATGQQYVANTPGNYSVVATTSGDSSEPSAATSILANPSPQLSYSNQTLKRYESLAIRPATGPSDNTTVSSIVVKSTGTYSGRISSDPTTGIVFVDWADPIGTYTITIRATDSCGAITDATFQLTIKK